MVKKRLLTTKELAEFVGISNSYLLRVRMTGKIRNRLSPPPHISVGQGRKGIRYDIRDIEIWMESNGVGVSTRSSVVSDEKRLNSDLATEKQFISSKEAAQYLGISEEYLRAVRAKQEIRDGLLPPPYVRIGQSGKGIRYEISQLDEWIDSIPRKYPISERSAEEILAI